MLAEEEVVFCFTDVEGSTRLAHELGEQFAEVNDRHRRAVRAASAANNGREVSTHGDAFFLVFDDVEAAVAAAIEIHAGLGDLPLRVRIGLHVGSAPVADGTYLGTEVNRAARISDAAHGGQTLVSSTVRDRLDGSAFSDLGLHRLKGFVEPIALFQLGDGEFPPPRTLVLGALPSPADRFVGRADEVVRLTDAVHAGARLLTVVGPGGSGKSRLVLEAAAQWQTLFPQWIPLADLEQGALVSTEIARAFGAESLEQLATRLGDTRAVALLDNAEHVVVDAAAAVADAIRVCPTLTFVVTSREPLRIGGEQLLPLRSLDRGDAVDLFVTRARQLNPQFDETSDAVSELCARLDDLPLAIELAAARTTLMTVPRLVERLRSRLDLLEPLQATLAWSYDLLTPEQRDAHARLSIFSGGCTLESAEEVVGGHPDLWQSLVEKSLLEVDHHLSETRLRMLETVRAFAARVRAALPDDEALASTYIDHYLAAAETQDTLVRRGETQLRSMQWYAEELANLRHAFGLSLARHDGDRAARLAAACGWTISVWNKREGFDWRVRALELPFDDPHLRVRLLASAASFAPLLGHPIDPFLDEAVAVADASGDRFLRATVLENKAFTVGWDQARPLLLEVIETMRGLGKREDEIRATINLGAIALTAFDWDEAATHSEHALALVRGTGNRDGIATTAINLAQAWLQLGELERPRQLAAEVRELMGELGDKTLEPICAYVDAVIAGRSGDSAAAAAAYAEGERVRVELGLELEAAETELRRQAAAAASVLVGDEPELT